jgi:hypothetical protein
MVLNEVALELQHYFVPIFVLLPQNPSPNLRLIGSGTLLEIEGTHHILTAAHVWHEAKGADQIGLALTNYRSRFLIRRDAIASKELWSSEDSQWGPDLALLEIPPPFVSTIAAHKSFLNLSQQRTTFASRQPVTGKELWAVTGMVGEFSKVQNSQEERIIDADIQARAFFSVLQQTHEHNEYDYIDLSAKDLTGVPSSFGGVSGGGLWDIYLSITKSGEIIWDEKRHFRGVAFWQSAVSNGRRVIRCHGPKSIFKTAWTLLGLSEASNT